MASNDFEPEHDADREGPETEIQTPASDGSGDGNADEPRAEKTGFYAVPVVVSCECGGKTANEDPKILIAALTGRAVFRFPCEKCGAMVTARAHPGFNPGANVGGPNRQQRRALAMGNGKIVTGVR